MGMREPMRPAMRPASGAVTMIIPLMASPRMPMPSAE